MQQEIYGAILRKREISGEDLYALVQCSNTGKWTFPKGHSNVGEQPFICALRKIAEKTGITELPDPIDYLQIGHGNYFIFNVSKQDPYTRWMTLKEMEKISLDTDVNSYRKKMCNHL